MPTITTTLLLDHGACKHGVAAFAAAFPGGLTVASDPAERAEQAKQIAEAELDVDWAAKHLLDVPARAEYDRAVAPAWAEYERVRAPAWAEYERADALALAAYRLAQKPASDEYERIEKLAWAEYMRVRAPAWAEYERARALALAEYERVKALAFLHGFFAAASTPRKD